MERRRKQPALSSVHPLRWLFLKGRQSLSLDACNCGINRIHVRARVFTVGPFVLVRAGGLQMIIPAIPAVVVHEANIFTRTERNSSPAKDWVQRPEHFQSAHCLRMYNH